MEVDGHLKLRSYSDQAKAINVNSPKEPDAV